MCSTVLHCVSCIFCLLYSQAVVQKSFCSQPVYNTAICGFVSALITFRMLRVGKCLWFVLELWKLTECFNCLTDFTFLTGIAVAAIEPIDTEYLVGLKLLFLMTLSCLTFLLRYNYINRFCVLMWKCLPV